MINKVLDEEYKNLANAIVLQAVKDYRDALFKDNKRHIFKLEKFFKSDWGKSLFEDSEEIVKTLPPKIVAFKRLMKRAKKKAKEEKNACHCPICGGWIDIWFSRRKSRKTKTYKYYWQISCKGCGMSGKIEDKKQSHIDKHFDANGNYIGINQSKLKTEKQKRGRKKKNGS